MKKNNKGTLIKGAIFISVGIALMLALNVVTPGMDAGRVVCYYTSAALWVAIGVIAPFMHGARTSPR